MPPRASWTLDHYASTCTSGLSCSPTCPPSRGVPSPSTSSVRPRPKGWRKEFGALVDPEQSKFHQRLSRRLGHPFAEVGKDSLCFGINPNDRDAPFHADIVRHTRLAATTICAFDHDSASLERRPSGRPAPGGERPVERSSVVERVF